MRELGPLQDEQHVKVLEKLKTMNLDQAILIGPEFCKFEKDYPGFAFYNATPDAAQAVRALSGKYILIKGSNSNKLSQLVPML